MSLDYYKQMKIHPSALKFPALSDEEYQNLKNSIKAHGLFEPIILGPGGEIIDGRHRWKACIELGIEPFTSNFVEQEDIATEKMSVEEYIFEANIHRRHLTESQRAAIAAEFADMRQGERTDLSPSDNCLKVGQRKAAELFKVSSKSVGRAKKVKAKDPETFAKLKSGNVSLNAAVKRLEKVSVQAEPEAPSEEDSETRWTAGARVVKSAMDVIDRYTSDSSIDERFKLKVLKLAFDALMVRLDDQADKLGVPEDELWGDWDENCLVI